MGKGKPPEPKVRRGRGPARCISSPPDDSPPLAEPPRAAPAPIVFTAAKLKTWSGRRELLAAIGNRLVDPDIRDCEQRALCGALRVFPIAREEENELEELQLLRQMKTQLDADAAARAAMESGVQFTDEGQESNPGSYPRGN